MPVPSGHNIVIVKLNAFIAEVSVKGIFLLVRKGFAHIRPERIRARR